MKKARLTEEQIIGEVPRPSRARCGAGRMPITHAGDPAARA